MNHICSISSIKYTRSSYFYKVAINSIYCVYLFCKYDKIILLFEDIIHLMKSCFSNRKPMLIKIFTNYNNPH